MTAYRQISYRLGHVASEIKVRGRARGKPGSRRRLADTFDVPDAAASLPASLVVGTAAGDTARRRRATTIARPPATDRASRAARSLELVDGGLERLEAIWMPFRVILVPCTASGATIAFN